jgi:hypothetical protein
MALLLAVAGLGLTLSTSANASTPRQPTLSSTAASFAIPGGNASTWTLKLWSGGAMKGSDSGTTGTLTVPVPNVHAPCTFQADVSVTPPGGHSTFYSGVRRTFTGFCGTPPSSIGGDIFLCSATGSPTTTEITGGMVGWTGPATQTPEGNPQGPDTVPAGTYTVTGDAPSAYAFVACQGSATIDASGSTASQSVVVPAGGSGFGSFYVTAVVPSGSLGGSGPPTSPGSVGPSSSPGNSGPAGTLTTRKSTVPTKVSASQLAFTGMNTGPLLLVGLLALVLGTLATYLARLRRRVVVETPSHSRSRR